MGTSSEEGVSRFCFVLCFLFPFCVLFFTIKKLSGIQTVLFHSKINEMARFQIGTVDTSSESILEESIRK